MDGQQATAQWSITVTVYHSQKFGHSISIKTQTVGSSAKIQSGGTWKGMGIPEDVLTSARAMVDALLTEHLVLRYGVAGELPMKWGGEPDPF